VENLALMPQALRVAPLSYLGLIALSVTKIAISREISGNFGLEAKQ
jgi:hypothetical protein